MRDPDRRVNDTTEQTRFDLAFVLSFVSGRRSSKPQVLEVAVELCAARDVASLHALEDIIEATGVVPFNLESVFCRLYKRPDLLANPDSWDPLWR
jgi:hypothetical protein